MKKRLYLKKWLQNTLIIITLLAGVAMGGMVDNLECPTSYLIIPLAIVIINCIILYKHGREEL